MPTPEAPFGWKVAGFVVMILAFGGIGYLCDIHSPFASPAIPFFGLFFLLALLALGGMSAFQLVSRFTIGRLVGLAFAAAMTAGAVWLFLRTARS